MTAYITEARLLAEKTADAYSVDRYSKTEWKKAAMVLLARDFTPAEAEWVLRSKFMRWAADASDAPYGQAKATHLIALMDREPKHYGLEAVRKHIAQEG